MVSSKPTSSGKSSKAAKKPPSRIIAQNKRAYHEYHVLEEYTAGISLLGTEIKSIRGGKVSMNEAFARIERGEVFLYGMTVSPYEKAGHFNHEPDRVRKLLLNQAEIRRLVGKIQTAGLTLVPLKLVFDRCWVKVELGLCKGKKLYDKRDTVAQRDTRRDIERAIKSRRD